MKPDYARIAELEREIFGGEPEPGRPGEEFLALFGVRRNAAGEVPWPPGFVLDWDATYAKRPPPGTVRWA